MFFFENKGKNFSCLFSYKKVQLYNSKLSSMLSMKKFILLFTIVFISFNSFAGGQQGVSDTINKFDANNLKHGYWITYYESDHTKKSEGVYRNGKKNGCWVNYYPNGKTMSKIDYKNNTPDGTAQYFHENGKLAEEGYWKIDKWVGEYRYYSVNGTPLHEWNYDSNGQRTGNQKYFYENGKLKYVGDWNKGKKNGKFKEYYDDGSLKQEVLYANDVEDKTSLKVYNPSAVKDEEGNKTNNNEKKVNNTPDAFLGDGYNRLFNKNQKLEQEGTFVRGVLKDGKKYIYDANGNLLKTLIFVAGKQSQVLENK